MFQIVFCISLFKTELIIKLQNLNDRKKAFLYRALEIIKERKEMFCLTFVLHRRQETQQLSK